MAIRNPRPLLLLLVLAFVARLQAGTIEEATAAVERIRGLRFTAPVHSVTIDRSELPARLRAQFLKGMPYTVDDYATILSALNLVDVKGGDVVSPLLDLYESQVLAYYDPFTRTYISIRQPPPALAGKFEAGVLDSGIAVHELTHALQDQNFHIGERDIAIRDDSDATLAYHALIEGEATLVMLAAMVGQTGASLDEVVNNEFFMSTLTKAAADDKTIAPSTPPYFAALMKFPYIEGLQFVLEAYRRGGWKELDRVYANPPATTREILHPAEYFERRFRPAAFVAQPPFPVSHISVEHMGEFHWRYLLGASNAEGWRSDRVTIAMNAFCEPTVLVESQWDSAADAQRFADAYASFLDGRNIGSLAKVSGASVKLAYGAERPVMERFLR